MARRRGIRAIVVVVLLGVLGIAWAVAEVAGRAAAEDYIRGQVVRSLELPTDARVDVGIEDGSLVLQALAGALETVEVSIPDARIAGIDGDLHLTADRVPLDPARPVGELAVRLRLDSVQATTIVRSSPGLADADIAIAEPLVRVRTVLALLGADIPVEVGLVPSAVDGALQLDPAAVSVNGAELDVDAVEDSAVGPLIAPLVGPREVCVAGYLPRALTLESATITGTSLDLVVRGRDIVLSSTDVSTPGSC